MVLFDGCCCHSVFIAFLITFFGNFSSLLCLLCLVFLGNIVSGFLGGYGCVSGLL